MLGAPDQPYPKYGQEHLSHPKALLDGPLLSVQKPSTIAQEKLGKKGESASQTPPQGGTRTQGAGDQQGDMPAAPDTQENGDAWVESIRCRERFVRGCCVKKIRIFRWIEGRQV